MGKFQSDAQQLLKSSRRQRKIFQLFLIVQLECVFVLKDPKSGCTCD